MKKSSIILIILAGCFFSCNKAQNADTPDTNKSELIRELQDFNNDLFSIRPPTKITLKQFVVVANADAVGAYAGGKIGGKVGAIVGSAVGNPITGGVFGAFVGAVGFGAVASWSVSPNAQSSFNPSYIDLANLCETLSPETIDVNDYSCLTEDLEDYCDEQSNLDNQLFLEQERLESVLLTPKELAAGEKHNVFLAHMEGKINYLPNKETTTRTGYDSFADRTSPLASAIIHSSEMESGYYQALHSGFIAEDNTIPTRVMNLFSDIFQSYPEDSDDVIFLINSYVSHIDASDELSDEEKTWIKLGLSVSLYSYNYWTHSEL